jgi:RNA polymerase sigma-70 factor (ECF subfamily)
VASLPLLSTGVARRISATPRNPEVIRDRAPGEASCVAAMALADRATVSCVGEPRPGDRVFVDRLRAGDDSALAALYDQHADVVFGIARRVIGDAQSAREITQEVFAHLWQHPERVDLERGSLRTYLAVMAHHRAVDEVRRVVRRNQAETRSGRSDPVLDDGHDAAVLDHAHRAWRGERVARAIEQLSSDQRVAVTLAYFEGFTYVEVARRLGIPEGTAKSRLRLALARLRVLLTDDMEALA